LFNNLRKRSPRTRRIWCDVPWRHAGLLWDLILSFVPVSSRHAIQCLDSIVQADDVLVVK
jgi:hypothetical protein